MEGEGGIWIFGATPSELMWLVKELNARPVSGGEDHLESKLMGMPVRLGVTGVGLASACFAVGRFLSLWWTSKAVMVGSCGAMPGFDLQKGDLVVATSEVLSEAGVMVDEGIGDCREVATLGLEKEIPLSEELARSLWTSASRVGRAWMGKMITVVGSSGDETQARKRARRFEALAENMEGYCVAWAGKKLGVEVGEIRGVANEAGDRDKRKWELQVAEVNAQRAIMEFLMGVLK